MDSENSSTKRYWYGPSEGYEARSQFRLQKDLGVDKATAETILYLRSQIVELQFQIRQLKSELNAKTASQNLRLARYWEVYYEATWTELEIQE